MNEGWPETFHYSPNLRYMTRNSIGVLVGAMLTITFVNLLLGRATDARGLAPYLLGAAVLWLWVRAAAQKPAAVAWPDHVMLPSPSWLRLRKVEYRSIVALERVPGLRLRVKYTSAYTHRVVQVPWRFVSNVERLETLLASKTNLQVRVHDPTWARLTRVMLVGLPIDQRNPWPHLVFVVYVLAIVTIVVMLFTVWGILLPSWALLSLTFIALAMFFGFFLWRGHKRSTSGRRNG